MGHSKTGSPENSLSVTDQQYRELVESANSIILGIDVAGNVTFFNEFAQRFFGYSLGEIMGKNVVGTIVPETESTGRDLKSMVEDIRLNPDRYVNNENENIRRNGERVWITWTNKPIRDKHGRVKEILCIGNDITDRKGAEEKLLESEKRLRTLSDNLPGGMVYQIDFGTDAQERRFTYVSAGVERLHGITAAQVLKDAATLYRQIVAEDQRLIAEREASAITDMTRFSAEVRFLLPSGEMRWSFLTSEPRRMPNGHLVFDGIELDITQRKQAEQAQRESEEIFSIIFKKSSNAVAITKMSDGSIVDVNDAWGWSFGYTREEAIGKSAAEMGIWLDLSHHAICVKKLEEKGEIANFETTLKGRFKDGTYLVSAKTMLLGAESCAVWELRDITERKRAEEARQKSESHYRALAENAPDVIACFDRECRYQFVNSAIFKVTKIKPEDFVGKLLGEVEGFTQEQIAFRREVIRNVFQTRTPFENEFEIQTPDGKHVFEWQVYPALDSEGNVLSVFSINRNITARKQAEEALIASKDRLSDAMDLARIVYWEVDLPTGNLILNDPFYTLYGTSAEREGKYRMTREEYGRRFVHPDDMWIFAQAAEKRRLNKEREFLHDLEYRIVRRDGEVRHILVRIRVSRDAEGHVTKYYGSNQDITARKVAEEALRKSEEQYRRIVDTTTEGIWTLDENFIITYVNKRIAEMLGYEPDELIGKTIMPCIFEEDIPAVLESRERRKQGLSDHFERRYRRKNGTTLWVHISATPTIDEEGRFLGAFAMFTDITDRKQAEEEKEKLQAQLRQSQKMEAIGTLAGGVAHDFNNILTAIMGFAYVLRMDLKSDDPKMAYVDQILSASQKAANLTQSLLAFSRKQQIDLELHRINDIIKQTTQLLKRLLTEDIELKVSLAHANPIVLADITQIDQILMNLTTNARDAMPKGGTMRIETGIVTLNEEFIALHGYGEPGEYALLSVSDTGTGMNDKTREHIFEPFFTTKEVGKGTGLGLSSVYGIVKQHSGYITVDSTLRKGTTFRIYLPLVHGEEEKKTSLEQGYVQGGNETILVAEDDPAVRMLVTDILHRFGYTTIEAVDGQDALRKFNGSKHIDLIIIDVVMPRMDGKELYEEIKRMNPNIKVLFTSGYTREVVIDKGVEDSMVDFIKKPIEPRELLGKVREVLDKREGERKRGK